MKNETKHVNPELELFKEKAAFVAIFFVTLMICGFFRMGDYSPLIAICTTILAMFLYFRKCRKAKKAEVV